MVKLHQLLAVRKGKKTQEMRNATDVYQGLKANGSTDGLIRSFRPLIEEDNRALAPETKLVSKTVIGSMKELSDVTTDYTDLMLSIDRANTNVRVNIVVDDEVLLSDVPLPFLLMLEAKLTDIHTAMAAVPILDPALNWHFDDTSNSFKSDPTTSYRTKKVPKNHVLSPATDKHPAQVQMYHEDIPDVEVITTHLSGAVPMKIKQEVLGRINKLRDAVKDAIARGNQAEVEPAHETGKLFEYMFLPLTGIKS